MQPQHSVKSILLNTPGQQHAQANKALQRSKSMPAGSAISAILSKRDPIRDRPVSAQKFREISATDSEMKVSNCQT